MNKKTAIIAAGAAVLVIAAVLAFVVLKPQGGPSRENTLLLARDYVDRGEYQRALDLLDRLLIEDAGDKDARTLRDEALARKEAADKGEKVAAGDALAKQGEAIAKGLESIGKDIGKAAGSATAPSAATTPPIGGSDSAKAAAEDAARQKAAEKAAAEAEARKQAEAAAKATDAERASLREAQALVAAGKAALGKDDYDGAKSKFSDAAAKLAGTEPKLAAPELAGIARSYYDAGRAEADAAAQAALQKSAIDYARDAAKKDPGLASPHYTLGKLNADLKQWDNAVDELKEAARLDPSDYLSSYELGKAYFAKGMYKDARLAFEASVARAEKLKVKFDQGYVNLGVTFRALKLPDEALRAIVTAIGYNPASSKAWLEKARILAGKGDAAGAIAAYKKVRDLEPDNASAVRELAVLYSNAGDYKEAEPLFLRALAIADDDLTEYNLAVVEMALGKKDEAYKYASKAAALKPASAPYQYALGLACEGKGDTDGAISAYAEAARLDKAYVAPRLNLGKIYIDAGFLDKALDVLLAAYAIDPKDREVNNNLGNVYGKKDLSEKSVMHYEKALLASPKDATILLNLARAYVRAGNDDKAKESYVNLVKIAPTAWDGYLELGKLLVTMGQNDEAKKYLQTLIDKNPGYPKASEARTLLATL